ncbi:MAG: hypothetical protein WA139_05355 [Candidatus Aenigmatarchaeota archaeon]
MKGQYITLENMFFFAVGIAMVIAIYATFSSISDSVRSAALQEQLTKEGESVRAGITRVFIAGNSTNSSISLSLEIPKELSGCGYKITSVGGNLLAGCMDAQAESESLNLYGIDTTVKNGAAYSSSGKVIIFYSGGKILLS